MIALRHRPPIISHPGCPMVPALATVQAIRDESSNTKTYTLQLDDLDMRERFRSQPGQFNMLYLFGVGEAAISISGDPEATGIIEHTIRHCGSVTFGIAKLRVGDKLGVRGPFGNGWPLEQCHGRDVILIAGGIGLAPLRPALLHILARRDSYGRVILVYGGRSPGDLMFQADLEAWSNRHDLDTIVTVDYPKEGWTGPVGIVTDMMKRLRLRGPKSTVMVCGPRIMNRFVAWTLLRLHVPQDQIFVSLERNMRCGLGRCGHCQYGPKFVCKDGPVFSYTEVSSIFGRGEV